MVPNHLGHCWYLSLVPAPGLELTFQNKNYLFWAPLLSLDTLNIAHQRKCGVQSPFCNPDWPHLGTASKAPCCSPLGGCVPHFSLEPAVSLGIPVHPPLTAYHQNQYKDTGEHLVVKFATGKTTAQSAYVPHSWEQGRVLGVGLLSNRYVTLP